MGQIKMLGRDTIAEGPRVLPQCCRWPAVQVTQGVEPKGTQALPSVAGLTHRTHLCQLGAGPAENPCGSAGFPKPLGSKMLETLPQAAHREGAVRWAQGQCPSVPSVSPLVFLHSLLSLVLFQSPLQKEYPLCINPKAPL